MKKVKISYACPIKWDSMQSLTDKIKFCGSCKMKVQDFTKESSLNTEGVHCGRFRMDQVESINRTFNFNPRQVFVVSLFSILGMTTPLAAQSISDSTSIDSTQLISKEYIKVTGNVKDEKTKEGIPFANVLLKNKAGMVILGATADLDGKFSLEILRKYLESDNYVIEVSVLGYETTELKRLHKIDISTTLNISLNESVMGFIVPYVHVPFDRNGTKTFGGDDIRESPNRQ